MVKKLFYVFMAFLFICAFTITTTPVYAQEEEEEVIVEDVADISLEDLLNVEITTAGKRPEKIGEVPASVVLVTRKDIETYGYQSLEEILQNIPGLFQTNDYFTTSVGVRGFWSLDPQRNMIVLVNGVKQVEGFFNANFLEQINIPVEAIDRIEVVRGPMSVFYGSGAFFGAINIKTNVIEEDNPVNMISASYGSENTAKVAVRASGKEGDFQYAFSGAYVDTGGLSVPFNEIDQVGYTTLETTEDMLDSTEKHFSFSGKFKGFTFDGSYAETKKGIFFLLPPVADGSTATHKVTRLSVAYEKELSDQVSFNAKLGYFLYSWKLNLEFLFPDFFAEQWLGNTAYDAEVNLFVNPTPQLKLTFGVNYVSQFDFVLVLDAPLLGSTDAFARMAEGESIDTRAAFFQLDYKLSDKLKIVAGARVEQVPEFTMEYGEGDDATATINIISTATYSRTKADFIPRVALLFFPNENNAIKLLYGKAINRPSFFQNQDILTIPGAIPLEPETIQTFELNYIGTLSPKFTASFSLFYNILEKLIFRSQFFVGGEYISYYANVGELKTTGAELTLQFAPSKSFNLELSGTYQDTKDQRQGLEDIEPGYSPKFLGYVKASLFLNDDISLAVTGNYVSEMESFYDPDNLVRFGEKVDGYFLLGANLRIRNLFGTGLFLNFRGSNLLDQEFRFPTTGNNNIYASQGTIGRGMSFLATLGIRFIPMPHPMP